MSNGVIERPTQLAKIVQQNGLAQVDADTLRESFTPHFAQSEELLAQSSAIRVTDATQVSEIKASRAMRLKLKEIRVAAEKTRKLLKEDSLRKGKAIDGIYNVLMLAIEPEENRLLEQEQFAERAEAARKAKLQAERAEVMVSLGADPSLYQLGEMSEQAFTQLAEGIKQANAARIEAERKAEAERLAAEAKRKEEEARVRAENEALRKQAEEQAAAARAERERLEAEKRAIEAKAKAEREAAEKAAAAERAKAEAARKAAEEAARKERDAVEAKARQEMEQAEAKARAEREELERKHQAAMKAKKGKEAAAEDLFAVAVGVVEAFDATADLAARNVLKSHADRARAAIAKAVK